MGLTGAQRDLIRHIEAGRTLHPHRNYYVVQDKSGRIICGFGAQTVRSLERRGLIEHAPDFLNFYTKPGLWRFRLEIDIRLMPPL